MKKDASIPVESLDNQSLPLRKQEPEKYIRTFAGDMETLKKGGVPNLAPLVTPPRSAPLERLVSASPVLPAPEAVPPLVSTLSQSEVPLPQVDVARDTLLFPVAEPPPPPLVTHLETYASDFRDRMKETHASTATVLAAEQDALPRAPVAAPESSSPRSLLYSIAGILLFIVGGVGAYIAYTSYRSASAPIVSAPNAPAPIFVDEREQISGERQVLLDAIAQSSVRPLALNNIRLLFIATTTTGSVFSALPLSAPDILLRNIHNENSMAGIVNSGTSQNPFFILSVSSYSNTFVGMLSWEAVMARDVVKLFPPYPTPASPTSSATSTLATTTGAKGAVKAATTTRPSLKTPLVFHDEVIANHDVRVYRDEEGRSVVLYGYWNQTMLVIARDPAAFTLILERLATSRTQ